MTYREKLAYLAGIIDGEGCITLWLQRQSGRHLCRISLCNTDEGILEACRCILKEMDIWFCESVCPPTNKRSKPVTTIEVNRAMEAKELAEKLLPYLQSCKRQKAIEFIQYVESSRYDKVGRKVNRRKKKGWG